MKGKKKNLV
jgi:hypothetical protein